MGTWDSLRCARRWWALRRVCRSVVPLPFTVAVVATSARAQSAGDQMVADFRRRVLAAVAKTNRYVDVGQFPAVRRPLATLADSTAAQYAGKWRKQWCQVVESTFDVQHTASLVSPFLGIVEGATVTDVRAPLETKEIADTASWAVDTVRRQLFKPTKFRLEYAYQQGHWVFSRGTLRVTWADPSYSAFSPEKWEPLWETEQSKTTTPECLSYAIWGTL